MPELQSSPRRPATRRWPDLSAYGLHFGVVTMPDQGLRMVMVDELGRYGSLAERMGFKQSRLIGVYVKPSLRLDIPAFSTQFPMAKIVELTDDEIRARINKRVHSRRGQRFSQRATKQMGWHPTRTGLADVVADAVRRSKAVGDQGNLGSDVKEGLGSPTRVRVARTPLGISPAGKQPIPVDTEILSTRPAVEAMEGPDKGVADSNVEAGRAPESIPEVEDGSPLLTALAQTRWLGMNHLGQDVLEGGDGARFLRVAGQVAGREEDVESFSATFLRGGDDMSAEDLELCASGLLNEIESGRTLRSEDFERYLTAIFGAEALDDQQSVLRLHAALDSASLENMRRLGGNGHAAFVAALRLHEGRPPYWRAEGSLATPLPMAVAMQSLAAGWLESAPGGQIIDVTQLPESNSWSLDAVSVSGLNFPTHDVAIGGVFGAQIRPVHIDGVRISRADNAALLSSLEKRAPGGLTTMLLTTDKAGALDPEFRRVLAQIGVKYQVVGLVDLDASMVGPGNTVASRLLVIGEAREERDLSYSPPVEIPVLYDYESLWAWTENVKALEFGEAETFGDDGREENRWQAPYIPASQVSEPEAMSPRNMLGPVRKALAGLMDRRGMGIDEFVASKLQWSIDEMGQYLSAEQVDAVALAIDGMDDGQGFVEADQTGLGKGRVLAALARYARLNNIPVTFLSEKSDLYADFYRDIIDIGSFDLFKNPFVVNANFTIRDENNKSIVPCRRSGVEIKETLARCEFPQGADIVMGTYSQFNREPLEPYQVTAMLSAQRALDAFRNDPSADRLEWIRANSSALGALAMAGVHQSTIDDLIARGVTTVAAAVADIDQQLSHNTSTDEIFKLNAIRDWLTVPDERVVAKLKSMIPRNSMGVKASWLRSQALAGGLLILDEAHNAAGTSSKTHFNVVEAVDKAKAVAYSSATFAKDTKNFALYKRVFPSSVRLATLTETLDRGGEPLLEIFSAMLAEDGRIIRREHDLSKLTFIADVDAAHVERNEIWADSLARVIDAMSVISGEVAAYADAENTLFQANAIAKLAASNQARANNNVLQGGAVAAPPQKNQKVIEYTSFTSRFYYISRAFTAAINADATADRAIAALKEGRKPVITFDDTMESMLRWLVEELDLAMSPEEEERARQAAEVSDDEPTVDPVTPVVGQDLLDGIGEDDSTRSTVKGKKRNSAKNVAMIPLGRRVSFRDVLVRYADALFTAKRAVIGPDGIPTGKLQKVNLASERPELAPAMAEVYSMIAQIPEIPISPIDHIRRRVEADGYSVAEITGRQTMLAETPDGLHGVVRRKDGSKSKVKSDFNSGQLDAVILSRSGSTGISLHASKRFEDKRQRELIEGQTAADIVQRLQFWGRVNRKDQDSHPIIRIISSGLPGEVRLQSMQNAKLRRMSANITGNADSSSASADAPDLLNKVGNEVCYRWLENNPKLAEQIGYDAGALVDSFSFLGTEFVDLLTSRILRFNVATQRRIYDELFTEFKAVIAQHEVNGTNPLAAQRFDIRATRVEREVLEVGDVDSSVFDAPVYASEIEYPISLESLDQGELERCAANALKWLEKRYPKSKGVFGSQIAKEIQQTTNDLLQDSLPLRFATVEEALAADGHNVTKNAQERATWLIDILPKLIPGSFIEIGDEALGQRDQLFIADLHIPSDARMMARPGAYWVEVFSARDRVKRTLSLSALLALDVKPLLSRAWSKYDEYKANYFSAFSRPITGKSSRVILEGNLFKAAELASSQRTGTAVTYTDASGVWHHAIVMPRSATLDSVRELPSPVSDAETLVAYLTDETTPSGALVADDFRPPMPGRSGATWKLFKVDGCISISLYVSGSASEWLTENKEVLTCLEGGAFTGARQMRSARVVVGKESAFAEAFLNAASLSGQRVLLAGSARPWLVAYNESRREANSAAEAQASQEILSAEIGADALDAEIEALGPAPVVRRKAP